MSKSPITCHVLDAAAGKPAAGVTVSLDCLNISAATASSETAIKVPQTIASGVTNDDGRCVDLVRPRLAPGVYKMTFVTGPYFKSIGIDSFYPLVEQHYHIPLLISPFSYTTYRGS